MDKQIGNLDKNKKAAKTKQQSKSKQHNSTSKKKGLL